MGMSKEPSVMTHRMATFWPVSTSRKLEESGAPSISRRGSESGSSRRNYKKSESKVIFDFPISGSGLHGGHGGAGGAAALHHLVRLMQVK